jgi:hypothetical protein
VYPDPRVVALVEQNFIPVRVHVREQKDDFKRLGERYGAQWTPTILVLDSAGEERHRIEGFLPTEDFLAQLSLGLAHSAFKRGDHAEAEQRFRDVVDSYPGTDAAAEALYWAGVAKYKASGDAAALKETARQFGERYKDTSWAKKASVWRG